ncbi:cadmium resistance transporter [Clostridium kluyveri]|uniref:Quaternary ammonium transporter n=1 Tax=Clostridium kluyveri TaxID=1534 RepID=A0A1L5F5L8_CLOKL|nr:cadmium resistance transporter [Clostridium kluyveri]APM38316.1 quaternary ammonium transporter [Clostridium kluyveri]
MVSTIITALVSFSSTNIDDIFVLMLFFSQLNSSTKIRHIIIGQYLGIGALTTISIIGAIGVSVIPHEYVGLLGLVPIYLGIKTYLHYKKESRDGKNTAEQKFQNVDNKEPKGTNSIQKNRIISFAKTFINPSVIKVTSVTFANGGDNIGIYIPLFASMNLFDILVTVLVFVLLIALWCFIGLKLAEQPFVSRNIEKYRHILVPIIFIGLGIFILIENGTISFISHNLF